MVPFLLYRQLDADRQSLGLGLLGPNLPLHFVDDLLGYGQAQAASLRHVAAGLVGPIKRIEQLGQVVCAYAAAVVGKGQPYGAVSGSVQGYG